MAAAGTVLLTWCRDVRGSVLYELVSGKRLIWCHTLWLGGCTYGMLVLNTGIHSEGSIAVAKRNKTDRALEKDLNEPFNRFLKSVEKLPWQYPLSDPKAKKKDDWLCCGFLMYLFSKVHYCILKCL